MPLPLWGLRPLLPLMLLLSLMACKARNHPSGEAEAPLPPQRMGWLGELAGDAQLLDQGGPGWVHLYRQELTESLQAFGETTPEDRVGRGRVYLELALAMDLANLMWLGLLEEYLQFRVTALEPGQAGAHAALFLAWAKAQRGQAEEAQGLAQAFVKSGQGEKEIQRAAEALAQGQLPTTVTVSGPAEGLLSQAPRILATDLVVEGQTQAKAIYRDPTVLMEASRALYAQALASLQGLGTETLAPFEAMARARLGQGVAPKGADKPGPQLWSLVRFSPFLDQEEAKAAVRALEAPTQDQGQGAMVALAMGVGRTGADKGAWLQAYGESLPGLAERLDQGLKGPGAEEVKRMEATWRLAACRATLAALALRRQGLPTLPLLGPMDRLGDEEQRAKVTPRQGPAFLLARAGALIEGNRTSEALQVLQELTEQYAILQGLLESARLVAIKRHIDTLGSVRKE